MEPQYTPLDVWFLSIRGFMSPYTTPDVQSDAPVSGLIPSDPIRGGFPYRILLIPDLFLSFTLIQQLGSLRFVYMHQISIDLRAFQHPERACPQCAPLLSTSPSITPDCSRVKAAHPTLIH